MKQVLVPILFLVAVCLTACGDNNATQSDRDDVEDGTLVNNEHREKVYDYFAALKKTSNADEERAVVVEFAAWLNEHQYKLEIEANEDGSHNLACPYMPTVTPWTDYRFQDAGHLDLLPQL